MIWQENRSNSDHKDLKTYPSCIFKVPPTALAPEEKSMMINGLEDLQASTFIPMVLPVCHHGTSQFSSSLCVCVRLIQTMLIKQLP